MIELVEIPRSPEIEPAEMPHIAGDRACRDPKRSKLLRMPFMYILKCADASYYVGSTWDLELRLTQHQSGLAARYTSTRLPVSLEYYEEYDRVEDAFHREKQVQGWGHEKREALIRGDFESLRALSRSRQARSPD